MITTALSPNLIYVPSGRLISFLVLTINALATEPGLREELGEDFWIATLTISPKNAWRLFEPGIPITFATVAHVLSTT